jgi:hypothetical protein
MWDRARAAQALTVTTGIMRARRITFDFKRAYTMGRTNLPPAFPSGQGPRARNSRQKTGRDRLLAGSHACIMAI